MPIYEYECHQCGHKFEAIRRINEENPSCPRCELPFVVKLISLCSFKMAETKFEIKRGAASNPYSNLTLTNVRGEDGKPITVNSERELHAAEAKYGFVHSASWGLQDKPPQHEPDSGMIHRHRKTKFNHDPAAYSKAEVEKAAKDVGWAQDRSETLADAPAPINH